MSKAINWIVAIIAQQDGEHCFEYADLEYSILSHASFKDIKYNLFYYEQRSSIVTIKEVQYNSRFKAQVFYEKEQPSVADIYKPETLVNFLKAVFLPDTDEIEYRYMTILWGHGVALGYLSQSTDDPDDPNHFDFFSMVRSPELVSLPVDKRKEYNQKLGSYSFVRAHLPLPTAPTDFVQKLFAQDAAVPLPPAAVDGVNKALELITARQLNAIFQQSLPTGKKIDVLIANSCYTQLFETGYALRDTVQLMIAPETTISFAGFNYPALFTLIGEKPESTLQAIAENVRDKFWARYQNKAFLSVFKVQRPVDHLALPDVSFSANLLEPYQDLLDEVINPLAEKFIGLLHGDKGSQIGNVRDRCADVSWQPVFGMPAYGVVDLTHFLTEFVKARQKAGDTQWDVFLEKLTVLRKRICAAWLQARDKRLYTPGRKTSSPNFLAIFFPSDGSTNTSGALFTEYLATDSPLVNEQLFGWIKFISEYHTTISIFFVPTTIPLPVTPVTTEPGPAAGNPA